jgi:hypothetical protein
MDGCSCTYAVVKGQWLVYSRNVDVTNKTTEKSFHHYHRYAMEVGLKERLVQWCKDKNVDLAVQGELCAPSINGGRTGVHRMQYYVFNVWDIGAQRYLDWAGIEEVAAAVGLTTVPVLWRGVGLPKDRVVIEGDRRLNSPARDACHQLVQWANELEYKPGHPAEGMVIKTDDESSGTQARVSCKVVASRYLMALEKKYR